MADPGAGPSRISDILSRPSLFEMFGLQDRDNEGEDAVGVGSRVREDSDSGDDFDIPHVSDDSGSSSASEEEDIGTTLSAQTDKFGWNQVENENNRPRLDPNFTVRYPCSSKNIDLDTCTDPIDFFSLFFGDELLSSVLRETNRYAEHFLSLESTILWKERHPNSRYHKWPEDGIGMNDLKKYLGLLLNMGLVGKKKLSDYWSTTPAVMTPFFNSTMNANLFFLIHRMLHISNITSEKQKGEVGFDPWCKIREVLDKVNHSSKAFYVPSRNISIDESMIGMKNRVVYIQYMPNKRHARFGIKKFQLCDSNGYIFHIQLYAGKDFDVHHEEGQAFAVVKHLMETSQLLNKGYHLYTDNFYTRPLLAEYLLERKTLLTGTVRANSKGLPEEKSSKLQVGECKFWRKGEMLCLSFREKKSQTKPVLLLTTAHNAVVQENVIRGREKKKPEAIFDYNAFMGGVDISDKQLYHYASDRSTRRYWKKIFQNLMDVSVLNSWILFNLSVPEGKKLKRDKYILSIVEDLCNCHLAAPPLPRPVQLLPDADAVLEPHRLILLEGRKEKDCFVCSDRSKDKKSSKGRKRTRHWCPACKVGCHEHCEQQLIHKTDQGLTRKKKRT